MWTARTAGAARHYDAITIVSAGAYLLLLFLIGYPRVAQVTDRVRGQGHQPTMLILKTVRE